MTSYDYINQIKKGNFKERFTTVVLSPNTEQIVGQRVIVNTCELQLPSSDICDNLTLI